MIAGLVLQFVTFGILQSFAVFSGWTVCPMATGNGGVPAEAHMILASVQQAAQAAADAAVGFA